MSIPQVELGEFIMKGGGSVNPAKHPDEIFHLYSIPAYDSRKPDEVEGSEIGSNKNVVQGNDVLLSRIVPHIRRGWIVDAQNGHRQIASGEWIIFRSERFDPGYLRYHLLSDEFNRKFMSTVKGIGGSLLRADPNQVAKFKIPLPPRPTQRRIAAILDKAQALVANDRRTLAVYDQLAKSLFLEMFGDPVRNERGWEVKGMRDVVERISDGPFGSNLKSDHYADTGVRVIRLSNVGVGVFVDKDKAFVREDHYEKIKKYSCGPGDVLVATMGTPNIRACKFPDHLKVAIHKADNILVRPRKGFVVDDYMVGLFNSPSILSMAENDMHGQTRTRISMGQIAKWEVPVPPLAVQQSYQRAIAAQEKLKRETETSLRRSEGLFGSLLQGAFAGELGG